MDETIAKERILSPNYVLSCAASFASFGNFYLLLATMPVFVLAVGGRESDVGLTMGIFSFTSMAVRPFVSKATYGVGTYGVGMKWLMIGGAAAMSASSASYVLAQTVPVLFAIRLLQGIGWGVISTACLALVASISPASRRGEAMGLYGMFGSIAMAVGPALGIFLASSYGFTAVFLSSAAVACLALATSLAVVDPAPRALPSGAKPKPASVFHTRLLVPSLIVFITGVTYSALVYFLPLVATGQGIDNPGLFFTIYAIVVVVFRGPLGRASDIWGRVAVIAPGLVAGAMGLALISQSVTLPTLLAVAFLYGFHFAAVQPTLMAWSIDRVGSSESGAAAGAFALSMDLGISVGGFFWGFVAQSAGFGNMYLAAATLHIIALGILLVGRRR
ncbi:MAG: MFS transporter [Chloroflexi bacterium]|nr:MFS transporter [Chloroflexota bacterium]